MTDNPNLQHILRRVVMPALAGAAGTGALSAYVAHKDHRPTETKGERRRRILRNAMYGSALGGAVGGALPTGWDMASQPFVGASKGMGLLGKTTNSLFDKGVSHALPIGTALGGGAAIQHFNNKHREEQAFSLARRLRGEAISPTNPAATIMNKDELAALLRQPGGVKRVLELHANKFGQGLHSDKGIFHANEMIQETGLHRGMGLKDIAKEFHGGSMPDVLSAYQKHLAAQGPFSKLMSKLSTERLPMFQNLRQNSAVNLLASKVPGAAQAVQGLEHLNPSGVAEAYGRFIRPSVRPVMEHLPPALKWGLLMGAGVPAANKLQQAFMGQ